MATRDTRGVPLSKGKYNATDLILGATGKKDISQVTSDDIKKLAVSKGFSKGDTRKMIKGFRNIGDSSLELDESGKEFNVFTKDGAADASSRKTGNKKGFDAGDLIGAGRNVNYLGGLASSLIGGVDRRKVDERIEAAQDRKPTSSVVDVKKPTIDASTLMKPSAKLETKKATSGNNVTPKKRTLEDALAEEKERQRQINEGLEINRQEKNFSDEELMNAFQQELQYRAKDTWMEKYLDKDRANGVSINSMKKASENFQKSLKSGKYKNQEDLLKTHLDMWDYQIQNSPYSSEGDLAVNLLAFGLGPAAVGVGRQIGKNIAFGKASPLYNYLRRTPMNTLQQANQLNKAAAINTSTSATKLVVDPVNKKAKDIYKGQAGNVSFPKTQILPETNPARMIPAKTTPITKRLTTFGEPAKEVKQLTTWGTKSKKLSEGQKAFFEREKAIKEASKKMAEESGKNVRKNGGVLMGQKGIKFKPQTFDIASAEGKAIMNQPIGKFNPYSFKPLEFSQLPSISSGFRNKTRTPSTSAEILNYNREIEGTPGAVTAEEEKTNPKVKGDGTVLEKVQNVGKYILPFIGEAIGRKSLKTTRVKRTPLNLLGDVERDMAKNYRPARLKVENAGSSLAESIAANKGVEEFNRTQEFQWNLANEAQKQKSRQSALNTKNQESAMNSDADMRTQMFNAQMDATRQQTQYQSNREPFIAAQQHLAKDSSEQGYYNSVRDASKAEMMIKQPEAFGGVGSKQYQEELAKLGYIPAKKKGGKFKIKK